jgi:predicted nucleotidyltransferase
MSHDCVTREADPKILEEAVRRIVSAMNPLRIMLFGSAARGTMGPDSDLDFLIVMPEGTHRRNAAKKACHALADLGVPKDSVVITPGDILKHCADPSLVIFAALADGKVIYEQAA